MELLVGLIAEFLFTLLFPVLAVIAEAVFGAIAFIVFHVFGYVIKRRPPARTAPPTASSPTPAPKLHPAVARFLIWTSVISGALLALTLAAAVVVNQFFFTPTIAWITDRISRQTGVEITFGEVEGSFLAGNFSVTDLSVTRRNTEKTEYALTTGRIDFDVDLLSLVVGPATLSRLDVADVKGEIWSKPEALEPGSSNRAKRDRLKPKRHFEIALLNITDAEITLHKPGLPSASLSIAKLESAPFHSYFAGFDVLFRSNIVASINGSEILISTSGAGAGRKTEWRLTDFPAELVSHYTDTAPFAWFEKGTLDVEVIDTWSYRDTPKINMDWRLILKGVKVVTPDNSSLAERAIGTPIADYINTREEDIDLRFSFVMDQEQFRSKSSLDSAGVGKAVLKGTAKAIAERTDLGTEQAEEEVKGAIDKVKGFLDRIRKKPETGSSDP